MRKMVPENNERRRSECDRGENVFCLYAPFVRIRNLKTVCEKWCQRTMNDVGANATEERMFSACMHHLFGYGT